MEEKKAAPLVPSTDPASSSSVGDSQAPAGVAQKPKKPLTAKQQAVYDLARPATGQGKTRAEIAALLGISKPVVSKMLQAAYRKLGLSKKTGLTQASATEFRNPEKTAKIIDALSDPLLKVKEALVASGLPERVSESVLKRLRTKFFGAVREVKALKTQEILRMCEEKLDMIDFYLDDKVMAEASARDLGLMAGVLIEKRALLRGEPTAIISDHERKKIHELFPALIAEAQRRGLTVDGQVMERKVEPLGTTA